MNEDMDQLHCNFRKTYVWPIAAKGITVRSQIEIDREGDKPERKDDKGSVRIRTLRALKLSRVLFGFFIESANRSQTNHKIPSHSD